MTTPSSLPPTLREVCDRALRLPCSPALLPRLVAVLSAPDSSSEEIAQLILVDASLAAATLRLANSAYFNAGTASTTVSDAVMRLGQRELYRLAALALVHRWETGAGGRGGPGDFCRHALCTAIAAEVLAEKSDGIDPQVAYTAGLVCDLGKLAVGHACAPFFPAMLAACSSRPCTWLEAEREILGYTHSDVAAELLRVWNFPPTLIAAAEYCERPAAAPRDSLPLLAHLHAAKYVATSFGPGVTEEGFLFELDANFLLEWGFTPERLEASMTVVHDRAQARLQDKLTHGALAF